MPLRTMARITAFSPGQSPPPVSMPMRIVFAKYPAHATALLLVLASVAAGGGSAISVPVTNSKGLLQVSPGDGLTSLTQVQPGGPKTSPVRYYPSGSRSFVRLVPTDLAQVETLLAWMAGRNADHIAIVHDDR